MTRGYQWEERTSIKTIAGMLAGVGLMALSQAGGAQAES